MLRAMIFDLDGTLIDTEKYYRICWPAAFRHFGYTMTDSDFLALRSLGHPFSLLYLKELSKDPDFDYGEVRAYRKKLFDQFLQEKGIDLKPGARELLKLLREKGIVRAVATATEPGKAREYLKMTGLYDCFDHIISAATVKEGKPSPDVYELAFEKLSEEIPDLTKDQCFAVEDSPNGLKSAYRAGLRTVYVPDLTPADEEIRKMAERIYPSLLTAAEELRAEIDRDRKAE